MSKATKTILLPPSSAEAIGKSMLPPLADAPVDASTIPTVLQPTEKWVRVVRTSYLTVALEELTLQGGREVSRRQLHPGDAPGISLGYAVKALEEMVR